ncbi:MAG: 3-isopropylmalate dehydrogenase [Deltaproteobacteria bacterium HGW-Deltaproteobacteria-14]|nr:MAG: 3-isopropylmalate dehydrogenase [Deltaproteobacteria bacterium HGW-Deltaproteobacteria-14]
MSHRIAVIGGDGIGPEVTEEAMATLSAAAPGRYSFAELPYGAEYTLRTGVTIPPDAFARLPIDHDAILLGALGDPRIPDMRHGKDILLGARMRFDLFINLRPARLESAALCPLKGYDTGDIDLVIFRENTEGLYVNIGGSLRPGTDEEVATNQMIATWRGTERIIRAAFEFARKSGRRNVCMASKHNAITWAHGVWDRAFRQVRTDYPDIESIALYADTAAMELVRAPERFQVIVASNFIGDILSDVAAQVVGGLGLAPSGNIHPGRFGLFEPVHGSAPDIAGTGRANPLAAILSAAMMARFLGDEDSAALIEQAVERTILDGDTPADLGGSLTTGQTGAAVRRRLARPTGRKP